MKSAERLVAHRIEEPGRVELGRQRSEARARLELPVLEMHPLGEEALQLGAGARVVEHGVDHGGVASLVVELAGERRVEQRVVRAFAPEGEGEARGDLFGREREATIPEVLATTSKR